MNDTATSAWRPYGWRRIPESNDGIELITPTPRDFLYDDHANRPDFFSEGDPIRNLKQNENHESRALFGSVLDQGSIVPMEGETCPETRSHGWPIHYLTSSDMSNVVVCSSERLVTRHRTAPVFNFTSPTNDAAECGDGVYSLDGVSMLSPSLFDAQGDRPICLSKQHARGNGIIPRKEIQKSRSSPIHKLVGDKRIRKKTGTTRRSLLNALNLIEQLRGELDIFPQLALPINHLEESVGEELLRDTRAGRPSSTVERHCQDDDSAYQSLTDTYSFGDTASISANSVFSHQHQTESATSVTSGEQSNGEEYSMDVEMGTETPRAQQPITPVYHCTFTSNGTLCNFTTKFRCDWIRHEESEKHWPQKRYMCLLCIEVIPDDEGQPLCTFCSERLPAPISTNNKAHFLQCEKAKNKGRHIFAAARDEHFRTHLRKFHGKQSIDAEAATWNFVVESKWPDQCGFCPDRFASWEERASHVAFHFEQGMDISTWKPQFPKPKRLGDHRPGINHQKHDDDDDDDDENHYPDHGNGNRKRKELSMSYTSSDSSPLPINVTQPISDEWSGWIWNNTFGFELNEDISRARVERYLYDQSQVFRNTETDTPLSSIGEVFHSQSLFQLPTSNEVVTTGTVFNVPAWTPDFIGRESVLGDIHKALAPEKGTGASVSIFVLHGLAGAGKTQMALEYCYQRPGSFCSILWANAETSTTLNEDFDRISKALGLETGDKVLGNNLLFNQIGVWLSGQKERWLLVFDNADESLSALAEFWSSALVKTPGSILITTRAMVNLKDLSKLSTQCQLALENSELTRISSKEILPPCEIGIAAEILETTYQPSSDLPPTTHHAQKPSKADSQLNMIAPSFCSYTPLSNSDSVRLITLHPAEDYGSQLRCDLTVSRLSEAPAYEALSYCWGSDGSPVTLETSNGCINISENLASALRATRSNYPRVLWVDTICINQADRSERDCQIRIMSEIYHKAAQVIVWLGTSEVAETEQGQTDYLVSMISPSGSPKARTLNNSSAVQPNSHDLDSFKQTLSSRGRHGPQYFKSLVTLIKSHNMDSTLLNLYFAGNSLIGLQGGFIQEEFLDVWRHWLQLYKHMDSLERVQTRPAQCQFPRCSCSKLLAKFGESVSHKGPCKNHLISQTQGYIEVNIEDDEFERGEFSRD